MLVGLITALLKSDDLFLRLFEHLFSLVLCRHQQVNVVHLTIELGLEPLNCGRRRVIVTLSLQLLSAETNELFLKYLVLMADTASLFLGLISLRAHHLNILLQICGTLL